MPTTTLPPFDALPQAAQEIARVIGIADTLKLADIANNRAGRNDEHPTTDALAKLKDGMTASEWREAVGWSETTFRRKREAMLKAKQVRFSSGLFYKAAA